MDILCLDAFKHALSYLTVKEVYLVHCTSRTIRYNVDQCLRTQRAYVLAIEQESGSESLEILQHLLGGVTQTNMVHLTIKGGQAVGRRAALTDFSALLTKAALLFGPSIKYLRYEGEVVPAVSKTACRAISTHATGLVKLDFNVGQLPREMMIGLARACSNMESLRINSSFVDDFAIDKCVQYLPRLRKIDLSFCSKVSNGLIHSIAKNMGPRLVAIQLMGCWNVKDRALQALARHAPGLKCINLFEMDGISDAGIAALCTGCTQLEDVDCGACIQLTDASLASLMGLRHLKYLSLFSAATTDVGLKYLCERGSSLLSLDLSGCRLITSDAFKQHLPRAVFSPGLVELEVSETLVTDECLAMVLESFLSLTSLQLSGCSRLQSSVLEILVGHQRKCKRRGSTSLSELDLKYCRNIPEDVLSKAMEDVDLGTNTVSHSQRPSYMDFSRKRVRL